MTKILFMHNTAMWYRWPFFRELSKIYDIKFIFTHMNTCENIYNLDISKSLDGIKTLNYKLLKNYLNFLKPHGIAFRVINEAMGDYDIFVGGSWDTLAEIIETTFCFIIARLRKKPIILWSETWKLESTKAKLIKPFIAYVVAHSDSIVVPGSKHKDYMISLGGLSDKIFIMPNVSNISVKVNDFEKKEIIQKELNLKSKKVILYVGRLIKRKGVNYLIEAFYRLRMERDDVVLIIIGQGECRKELERISKTLGIDNSIFFRGYIEDDLLSSYYLICDICVVPSVSIILGDPWVFVVNEAMYFGKPVIASDAVGSAFDMIYNGVNGFIVPEKDSEALYIAMNKILSDSKLKTAMGNASAKIIRENFKYDNMVDGFRKAVTYVENAI